MLFFDYSQNNSGGSFSGPWHLIIVEAANGRDADDIATQHGAYFDGCDHGRDCSCCGDRWYSQNNSYSTGEPAPMFRGIELEFKLTELEIVEAHATEFATSLLWHDTDILVVYANGSRREWHFTVALLEHAKELDRKVRSHLYGFRVGPDWVGAVHKCFKDDVLSEWYATDGNNFIGGEGWRTMSYGGVTFGSKSRKEAVEAQKAVKVIMTAVDDARKNAIRWAMKADTTLSPEVHVRLLKMMKA